MAGGVVALAQKVNSLFCSCTCCRCRRLFLAILSLSSLLLVLYLIIYYPKSADLHSRVVTVDAPVLRSVEQDGIPVSSHESKKAASLEVKMSTIGRLQQSRISAFCAKYKHSKPKHMFPVRWEQRRLLYRHLIYDDRHKFLFCFVEKAGCTNMKRLLFMNMGLLPLETSNWNWVDSRTYLDKALRKASFTVPSLSLERKVEMVKTYYKVIFIRHPLERLLSAYRDKIEPPLDTLSMKFPYYLKREILETYRSQEYSHWLSANASYSLHISFPEFIRYVVDYPNNALNPHLRPQISICHPCRIKYNYYGNFKTMNQDVAMVMDKIKAKPEYYHNASLHSDPSHTSKLMLKYYSQLSKELCNELFDDWFEELDFYYHLNPEEKESHKQLLQTNKSVM